MAMVWIDDGAEMSYLAIERDREPWRTYEPTEVDDATLARWERTFSEFEAMQAEMLAALEASLTTVAK